MEILLNFLLLISLKFWTWEKFVRKNKDLDKEIYGLVKWVNPKLSFCLNVGVINHFNLIENSMALKEQVKYSDWLSQ